MIEAKINRGLFYVVSAFYNCAAPPNDNLRLDIVLPGDRYIYIKAASREERQRWMVALGNARRDNPEHSGE